MGIFKKQKKENAIIIGCGSIGAAIAKLLSEQNKSVSIIDTDENAFKKLPTSYNGCSVAGDGTDIDILASAGAKNTDILVASTDDDNTNIMIAQIAKQIFMINKVVTVVKDMSRHAAYKDMNIESICPAMLSVNAFESIVPEKEIGQL
jgi:trk system potassium uptake protein TrkA